MCFAAVGGLVLSSEDESRLAMLWLRKNGRRLYADDSYETLRLGALRFAARCAAASLLKVQNRTARKPYIEDKEGLEEGIPNFKRLGEGSLGLVKDYKTGFLSIAPPILTAYMPARQ